MSPTMNRLRSGLERARGQWPKIATDTAIDYYTIARIARGDTENPRIDTVESLLAWIDEHLPAKV